MPFKPVPSREVDPEIAFVLNSICDTIKNYVDTSVAREAGRVRDEMEARLAKLEERPPTFDTKVSGMPSKNTTRAIL